MDEDELLVEDATLAMLDIVRALGMPSSLAALALARAAGVLSAEEAIPPLAEVLRGRQRARIRGKAN
jgi:hypothetical protein